MQQIPDRLSSVEADFLRGELEKREEELKRLTSLLEASIMEKDALEEELKKQSQRNEDLEYQVNELRTKIPELHFNSIMAEREKRITELELENVENATKSAQKVLAVLERLVSICLLSLVLSLLYLSLSH